MRCGKTADGKNLVMKACAGCESVYYCSKACQKLDWAGCHKRVCNETSQLANKPTFVAFMKCIRHREIFDHLEQMANMILWNDWNKDFKQCIVRFRFVITEEKRFDLRDIAALPVRYTPPEWIHLFDKYDTPIVLVLNDIIYYHGFRKSEHEPLMEGPYSNLVLAGECMNILLGRYYKKKLTRGP